MSALKIIAVILISMMLSACVGSLAGAYRVFGEDAYSGRIRPPFRRESGHRSDGNPAGIPI